ncbi:hypothetical protein E5161_12705 [Cohnella pontilimi]|uniref:Uncharacterized protein n=1 Tax=Cohnella pontilimi TaxID=2564100 RepID=A0A4U0F9C0_9BACL|nr:hypothetical protein [Cohnella pontilimi]TJY41287.1 hypothetical protein E5161_12705 [Cohnella pontilimi]
MNNAFCRGAAVLLALVTLFTPTHPTTYAAGVKRNHMTTLIVRSSPKAVFESRYVIHNAKLQLALRKAKQEEAEFSPSLTDVYVIAPHGAQENILRLEQSGNLWDEEQGKRLVLPRNASHKLLKEAQKARNRHYGDLIPWKDADSIVYRKSVFTITDLETGLSFRVQRRAGSDHADVQPTTKEDTKMMKRIYEGRWSWKRKAILVSAGGRRLAASMNGMPHGGDGIPDNDFSGHFCVHFLNSTTHRSEVPDPAHQFMVYKAAGKTRELLHAATPRKLAQYLVQAMNDRDLEIVRLLAEGVKREKSGALIRELDSLVSVKMIRQSELDQADDLYSVTFTLEAVELHPRTRIKYKKEFQFMLIRQLPESSWRMQDLNLDPEPEKNTREA